MNISLTFKRLLIVAAGIALVAAGYFTTSVPQARALTSLSEVQAGDLIRGETFSAVYYMGADGFRYVFTNDKNFFTWYDNFNSVKFISDADLATIQIGGNVTYKPGTRMLKINTDPKTYAVSKGGVLRHVTTESIAISLYGSNWNQQIDDVSDSFFSNYTIGDPISDASQYSASTAEASVSGINDDKSLVAPKEISITSSGYSPIDVTISAGQSVRFTNNDTEKHTATSDELNWGTGTLSPGDSYIQRFKEAGTFSFFDGYDSSNTGAVYAE